MYLVANTNKHHILYREHGDFTSSMKNYNAFIFHYQVVITIGYLVYQATC